MNLVIINEILKTFAIYLLFKNNKIKKIKIFLRISVIGRIIIIHLNNNQVKDSIVNRLKYQQH